MLDKLTASIPNAEKGFRTDFFARAFSWLHREAGVAAGGI
jgi:hypothetical protein